MASPSVTVKMTTVQELKDLGEAIGLKGTELKEFITEQQALARQDRVKQLEADKEAKQLQLEADRQAREAEAAKEARKLDAERESRDAKRLDAENEARRRDAETEAKRLQMEADREARQHELAKMELEKQKLEMEIQMRFDRLRTGDQDEGQDLTHIDTDAVTEAGSHAGSRRVTTGVKGPKMPCFDETKDDMDAFLHRFEIYAAAQAWREDTWALYLSALLKGKALEVYARLPVSEAQKYQSLKDALLKRFNLTEEGFKRKFKSAKPETSESPGQFITRLESYLNRWIDLAGVEPTFEGLKHLVVREQYLESCSPQLAVFLRERKPDDLEELAHIAEQYLDAHNNKQSQAKADGGTTTKPHPGSPKFKQTGSVRGCFNCGKRGHIARDCFKRPYNKDNKREQVGAVEAGENNDDRSRINSPQQQRRYYGNQRGSFRPYRPHYSRQYSNQSHNHAQQNSGQYRQGDRRPNDRRVCRAHQREQCNECLQPCTEQCQAAIHFGGSEARLECGCILPVVVDACKSTGGRMIVGQGVINGTQVRAMRDSGCSTVVVKKGLVRPEQFTGHQQTCILIDGTVRRVPLARLEVETPFFIGTVHASCMENPLYDVIIGNIPGAKTLEESQKAVAEITEMESLAGVVEAIQPVPENEVQLSVVQLVEQESETEVKTVVEGHAVVTRAQAKQPKQVKPLRVVDAFDTDVDRKKLIELQQEDQSLKTCLEKADSGVEDRFGVTFKKKKDVLYRQCKDRTDGREVSQVVLPRELRYRVMKVAHETLMSGHQGCKKTKDRVWSQFWWPGFSDDVVRFCKSCDICQRTVEKGRVGKVPLGRMPLIETPFDRVAVDLIGPIYPASDRGHRFILTLVDYATRYPEAVPLKDIETETVAEALVNMFSRVGIPKEVLSDRGSQFMSKVMKEVCRLLSVKQLFTTPYHPMCNGLVEKFNGTLKNMLKRMSAERPKDWDRYISALLFAYREVKQESLGFSPFELIYGRTVRGPMSVMKELLVTEEVEPEVKTTYEYVLDLKEKLQQTCELAQQELAKAQSRQRKYFNQKAKERSFRVGDKVLVLLPTNQNKLLLQWKGPFEIIEKVRDNDYRIQMEGRTNLFHANMLKQYHSREEESSQVREVQSVQNDSAVVITQNLDSSEVVSAVVLENEDEVESVPTLTEQLYEVKQGESFKDVDICPDLTEEQKEDVRQLLEEFSEIFTDVPGRTTVAEHSILLTTGIPVYSKPYPLPHSMQEVVEDELDSMLKLGVIEPSSSPYASPIVLVRKPDGTNRVCVDFRKLNKITVFDPEPMPQISQIFSKLKGDRFFSTFDVTKGYWSIPMREQDKLYTAFVTHKGLFQFTVMPFGLVNAPATFNRMMRRILSNAESLDSYVDDVLLHTVTWEQQLCAMHDFFVRVCNAGLTLKPSKCHIGYDAVPYLGHKVGTGHLEPKAELVEKIAKVQRPKTKSELRSFMGLMNYYRQFIPNFATIAEVLTELTKKGYPEKLQWLEVHEVAFSRLKGHLTTSPILCLPDFSRVFVVQTDACDVGIGCSINHEYDGVMHPIAYASKKLLPRERNYSTVEKECLSIVWAIQKFQDYLYGKEFILETDHSALQYLQNKRFQNGRLMRWALALQPYRFTIRYIKGKENVCADFLSRNPIE